MADTVTILNKETVAGGDAMDESLVPNSAAPGGMAKRPRVVLGDDDGALVDVAIEGGITKLHVKAATLPLPVGAATEATVAQLTKPSDQQHVLVDNFPPTQAVTGPLTNTQLRAAPLDVQSLSTTAVRSTVSASLTDVLLLSSNVNRKKAIIFNNSNTVLFIGLGTASVYDNDFSYLIAADSLWEIPSGFVGEVRGYWASVDGSARITELT